MAMFMACVMVVGNTGIVAHAEYWDDGCYHGDGRKPGGSSLSDGSDDIGGNYPGPSYSDSGSSYSGASYSAPAPKAVGSTTSVTGKETFHAVAKAGDGIYKVIHKGVDVATFILMDSDKKAVPCTAVFLKQREDGKWAIEFQVTEKYAEATQAAATK